MSFGENVDPTAAIRAIIGSYPFSIGIFREFLQNSDDAKASRQVFILDFRRHSDRSVYDRNLAKMQGPAMLAYNDSKFTEEDWTALQNIHRSSKRTDTSKIGKYGMGFRASYHLTDGPQILSSPTLAILDPLHDFSKTGGVKLDFVKDSQYEDHISAFCLDLLDPESIHLQGFRGSVIRLPLRTASSTISSKIVTTSDVHQLLTDFISDELQISLLFLQHIKSIEVYEIDVRGQSSCLARSTRSVKDPVHASIPTRKFSIETCTDNGHETTEFWCVLEASSDSTEAGALLTKRIGRDAGATLLAHKLKPSISIAVPLSILTEQHAWGRLFTYLPLPLPTRFPIHIHGLFALTQSREKLRNREENGLVHGSDDHILVEWNQLLFDVYLPVAWKHLLGVMRDEKITDIFRAWPPAQSPNQLGDSGYWKDLPKSLIACLSATAQNIWPIVDSHPRVAIEYRDLSSVLVAAPDVPTSVLEALVTCGLNITRPPAYITELLRVQPGVTFLSPESAHTGLTRTLSKLRAQASSDNRPVVLSYLLSGGNLRNIVDLPLLPLNGGTYIALSNQANSKETHVILESYDYQLFGPYDDRAIALDHLEAPIAKLLYTHGPGTLNVEPLMPQKVVGYLNSVLLRLQAAGDVDISVRWLSKFWDWMAGRNLKDNLSKEDLYSNIEDLSLLPTTNGLKLTNHAVCDQSGIHPAMVSHLRALGVSFLHPTFPNSSKTGLKLFRSFSNLDDLHQFLDIISISPTTSFDMDAALLLVKHITRCASLPGCSVNERERQKLRTLPVYPSARTKSMSPTSPRNIPDGHNVIGISTQSLPVLPVIPETTFLDATLVSSALIKLLDPNASDPLVSDLDVLSFALGHFEDQPPKMQSALVEFTDVHRNRIPPNITHTLRTIPFIYGSDGTKTCPIDLIDPHSDLAPLFAHSERLPRRETTSEQKLVASLSSLRAMQADLTTSIVKDRIRFIDLHASELASRDLARKLLDMLYKLRFDCTQLEPEIRRQWLPTPRGLLDPSMCWDDPSRKDFFDQVLTPLDWNINIPPTMRAIMGWDKPLPLDVLVKQLVRTFEHTGMEASYTSVHKIVKELSRRNLTDADITLLHGTLSGRAWVPTTDQILVQPSHAVFSGEDSSLGFYKVASHKSTGHNFFLRLGCSERPSSDVILSTLGQLVRKRPEEIARQAHRLLRRLPRVLTEAERCRILVPDTACNLTPITSIFFNDIGNKAFTVGPRDIRYAHASIDDTLAEQLGIKRLGLKFASLNLVTTRDLGERPIVTIRNKLREYTEAQFLTEFMANAADAKANAFGILVDDYHAPTADIIHVDLAKFQECSSLVIHNNAQFTDTDFNGICDTGFGGKQGRSDSIGQFGSGALTMFHFTEMATIVSGDKVLFMNPSKSHLSRLIQDRVLMMSLAHVNSYFPHQLASLNGLFGFNSSSSTYNGTLFRLPLRNASHLNTDCVSQKVWTGWDVKQSIIQDFQQSAHEFLLFTTIECVEIGYRDSSGTLKMESIRAVRTDRFQLDTYESELVNIRPTFSKPTTWNIATTSLAPYQHPPFIASISEKYRLRSPFILGLAAQLDGSRDNRKKLFSTLPLPISSTIPVHLTAPFILSSDRRQIRSDVYNNLETKYNQWIIKDMMPPLYIFLLSDLLRRWDQNDPWWPGDSDTEDDITEPLVSELYRTHLAKTDRHLFRAHYTRETLSPKDAVVMQSYPEVVLKLFGKSRPRRVVLLPARVCRRAVELGKIEAVGPIFLKNEILQKLSDQLKPYIHARELLDYVIRDSVKNVTGLPLLPLADGSYGVFEDVEACTQTFYDWKPTHKDMPLFRSNRLVHPKFPIEKFLKAGLNVSPLKGSAVKVLLGEVIEEGDEQQYTNPHFRNLITTFWKEYPRFESTAVLSDIYSFPLVLTRVEHKYVSLSRCKDESATFISNSMEPSWLWDWLVDLGLTVVVTDPLPRPLKDILRGPDFNLFTFEGLLSALRNLSSPYSTLSAASHQLFAAWARPKISSVSSRSIAEARRIPIWPSIQTHIPPSYLPATDIIMLPEGVTRRLISRFKNIQATKYSPGLVHLGIAPLTFPDLFQKFGLRDIGLLDTDLMVPYHSLLSLKISQRSYGGTVLVPNCNRVMCLSNTLFARDPLFLTAFGESSPHFVAPTFRDLERQLYNYGLKRQSDRNIHNFIQCARAIDQSFATWAAGDRQQRATVAFNTYCNELQSTDDQAWDTLNTLRFIPRHQTRRSSMATRELSAYVKALDDIVAPSEIVLARFESIAWTQRALMLETPSRLPDHPLFGHPSAFEVVQHLCVLALRLSQEYTRDPLLLEDITETYQWLNENVTAAKTFLLQHNGDRIFLNVVDPTNETWVWHSADELLLGIQYKTGTFFAVQDYLLQFERLLSSSGVQKVSAARLTIQPEDPGSGPTLENLLSEFRWMRDNEKLTDVVFVTKDDYGEEQKLPAHRALLATSCEHFKNSFAGMYSESRPASSGRPIEVQVEYSTQSVQWVLDYIYSGQILGTECEQLLEVLELSNYWGITKLHLEAQWMIVRQGLITPETVGPIKERAREARADEVVEACARYESENWSIIQRVQRNLMPDDGSD